MCGDDLTPAGSELSAGDHEHHDRDAEREPRCEQQSGRQQAEAGEGSLVERPLDRT